MVESECGVRMAEVAAVESPRRVALVLSGSKVQENFDHDSLGDICDQDDDNDGVLDVNDRCQFSVLPEAVPTEGLLPNHYADIDGDGFFESVHPKYKSIIEDTVPFGTTNGCSCEEIFNLMPGNHEGEKKYGCPKGTLDMWSKRGAGGGS